MCAVSVREPPRKNVNGKILSTSALSCRIESLQSPLPSPRNLCDDPRTEVIVYL